jgi:zeaxanthin glucosyltransferase
MANILISIDPAVSHLFQTFNFANDLKTRGHIVTYVLADDSRRAYVESHGFHFYHFRPALNLPDEKSPSLSGRLVPIVRKIRRLRQRARAWHNSFLDKQAFQALAETLTPNLVVLETNMPIYAFPLLGLKIPVILVCSNWPQGYRDNAPQEKSHFIPTSSRLSRYRCLFEWAWFRTQKYVSVRLTGFFLMGMDVYKFYRRAARHYGLSAQDLFDRERSMEYLRLPEMCLCPAAFDFPRELRPNRYFLDSGVRPADPEDGADEDFPWDRLSSDIPTILCSFGSILSESRRWRGVVRNVLREIIGAFSNESRFQLVVGVGAKFDISEFDSAPSHILVVNKWIPQIKILRRASVHITHGGLSSIRESIECKVPMIVIPFISDQPGNAARVVYHNLGVRVMLSKVVGAEIVKQSKRLVDSPIYKESLGKMKLEFDHQRAKQSAADFIESRLLLTPKVVSGGSEVVEAGSNV